MKSKDEITLWFGKRGVDATKFNEALIKYVNFVIEEERKKILKILQEKITLEHYECHILTKDYRNIESYLKGKTIELYSLGEEINETT